MFQLNKALFVFLISFALPLFVKAQNPVPSITLATTTGCVNAPISLSGSASPSNASVTAWAWTSNPTTATFSAATSNNTQFTASAAGSYTITLTVTPGGATATTTVTISANPTVNLTPSADTVCIGSAGTLLTASGTATSYSWLPASGLSAVTGATVTATPTSNTTYTVTGTLNGCTSTASSQITSLVVSPVIASALNNYICIGSTTSMLVSAPSALSYSWTPSTGLSCNNCGNPIVTPTDTTIYTVTVTGNCFSNTTDTVIVYPVVCGPPVAGFSYNHSICRYSCVTFQDTSVIQPLAYKWYFTGGIPDSSSERNPTVCYNVESGNAPGGKYPIMQIVTNILGQKDTVIDSIIVKISPVAGINNGHVSETIEVGNAVTLNALNYTTGGQYYTWSPSTGLNNSGQSIVEASPQVNTVYIVTVTNNLGCKDKDTILVKVQKICGEVFIPTAFSPNGDGVNDYAKVLNNNCIRSVIFSIFDRWGNKVFSTDVKETAAIGWDGTLGGSPMDAGVFVYYVDAVLSDNTTVSQKGNITLVR
jgi:gliding motility-associated-like protein